MFYHFRETTESEFSACLAKQSKPRQYSIQVLSNQSPKQKTALDECLYNGQNENQRLWSEMRSLFGEKREDLFGSQGEYVAFLEDGSHPFALDDKDAYII